MLPKKKSSDCKASDAKRNSRGKADAFVYTPENGLRLLARMMAEAYLEEIAAEARSKRPGYVGKLFIKKIQISMDCLDLNLPKIRQQLHSLIDEALERANQMDSEATPPNQSFQPFKKR